MTMPFITVLLAARAELAAAVAGHFTLAGDAIGVRHHRHRESTTDEAPCVALRFMSNDPSSLGEQTNAGGLPELVMEMATNLVIDMPLPPEADTHDDLTGDPTGFGEHAAVLALILDRLFPDPELTDQPNTVGGTTWQIRYDGTAPDEGDATPDFARMEERLVFIYRVRADRPTELLMES